MRRDEEFRAAVRDLTAQLHTVVSHRDHLEARLIHLRDGLPGRAYRAARTLLTFGAWR